MSAWRLRAHSALKLNCKHYYCRFILCQILQRKLSSEDLYAMSRLCEKMNTRWQQNVGRGTWWTNICLRWSVWKMLVFRDAYTSITVKLVKTKKKKSMNIWHSGCKTGQEGLTHKYRRMFIKLDHCTCCYFDMCSLSLKLCRSSVSSRFWAWVCCVFAGHLPLLIPSAGIHLKN